MSEETTIDASTPVTGQSRMDAAWGSDSSDVATVAKPVTQTGQVFEQVYVPWQGKLNPRWMRNWAIFRHHVLGIVRKGHRPWGCLLYTSPSPRDLSTSRMPSSA